MEKLKKTLNVLSYVALAIFVIFVILIVGVRIFGIRPYIVLSGSMEPEIKTGALVYAKKPSPEEASNLEAGDNVTYIVKSGAVVTHKIYEVVGPAYVKNQYGEYVLDENGNKTVAVDDNGYPIVMYTTYGINNENSSSPTGYTLDGELGVGNLASSNVIGKPIFTIPYLGYVAHFVQNPPGKYIALMLCAFLLFTTFFTGSSDKDGEEQSANAENSEPEQAE